MNSSDLLVAIVFSCIIIGYFVSEIFRYRALAAIGKEMAEVEKKRLEFDAARAEAVEKVDNGEKAQ
jgi:hypothetical protein